MLIAYEDFGQLLIKDIPMDETRIGPNPIDKQADAIRICGTATAKRPDVNWEIVGNGPWGVHGRIVQYRPPGVTSESSVCPYCGGQRKPEKMPVEHHEQTVEHNKKVGGWFLCKCDKAK